MALQRATDNEHVLLTRLETQFEIGSSYYDAFFTKRLEIQNERSQFVPVVDLFSARKSWWKNILPRILTCSWAATYSGSSAIHPVPKEAAIDLTGFCPRASSQTEPKAPPKWHTQMKAWRTEARKAGLEVPAGDRPDSFALQSEQLFRFGYNPTILLQGERIQMCYRYHDGNLSTKLAVAECDESGLVFSNRALAVPGKSVEDPRFFTRGGQPYLSWVESNYPDAFKSVVKYGRYDNGAVTEIVQPSIGANDWSRMEKNWTFFEHKGSLYCIYEMSPVLRVFEVRSDGINPLSETPGPRWPYGQLRGATTPVLHEDKLVVFCHSSLDNEPWPPKRRYYIGAVLLEPEPPFSVVSVSRKPIIYGSEEDRLTPAEREACIHYKRNVVFVGGAYEADNYWIMALGENDSACVLVKIRANQFNFT
jgi:predicted GH43/DUF377 family glycosyl hydrolase